jgi:hypothetical protein
MFASASKNIRVYIMRAVKVLIRKFAFFSSFFHPLLGVSFCRALLRLSPNSFLLNQLVVEMYLIWLKKNPKSVGRLDFQSPFTGPVLFHYTADMPAGTNTKSIKKILDEKKPSWFLNDVRAQKKLLKLAWKISEFEGRKLYDEMRLHGPMRFQVLAIVEPTKLGAKSTVVKPSEPFEFFDPLVYPSLERKKRVVSVPEATVIELEKVEVVGAFQAIDSKNLILCEPAAHPKQGNYVAGMWRYFELLGEKQELVLLDYSPEKSIDIETGILISGRATENYFHWMIEYIPKLYNVQMAKIPAVIPIIVKSGLPRQFYECLNCFNVEKREIIQIDPDTVCAKVKRLYVPSVATFHPDNFKMDFWLGGAISKTHLQFLRSNALAEVDRLKVQSPSRGKKIYITRPSLSARGITNQSEIGTFLKGENFEIVFPERLSFLEQVALFNGADCIVGVGGAAFSNLIYCNESCVVFAMVSERNMDYSMQGNLANFAGATYVHLTGPLEMPKRNQPYIDDELAHGPFSVSVDNLRQALRAYKVIS